MGLYSFSQKTVSLNRSETRYLLFSVLNKPNRLTKEKSPYLLQHAKNPVDWYPWGKEAFSLINYNIKPYILNTKTADQDAWCTSIVGCIFLYLYNYTYTLIIAECLQN